MVLYIDETQNDNYFIVACVVFDSKETELLAYKQFKKAVENYPINSKLKQKVFNEFKATLLDRSFPRIKRTLLENLKNNATCMMYSVKDITNIVFNQLEKENSYISLLTNIVNSLDFKAELICDNFNLKGFEDRIISTFSRNENVISVKIRDSKLEGGLQFADNVCSTIRHYVSGADNELYSIISSSVKKV